MEVHVVLQGYPDILVLLPEEPNAVWQSICTRVEEETGLDAANLEPGCDIAAVCAGDRIPVVPNVRAVAQQALRCAGHDDPSTWPGLLDAAVVHRDIDRMSLLLDAGCPTEPPATPSPLFQACLCGHADIALTLLQHGAPVESGWPSASATPLYAACLAGSLEIVRLLLERGADPLAVTAAGDSTRLFTVRLGTEGLTAQVWVGATPLNAAARRGFADVVEALINAMPPSEIRTQVRLADVTGRDPLLLAASHGAASVVPLLLAHGGVLEPPPFTEKLHNPYHPCSPLEAAVERGYRSIAVTLIEHGADVNRINNSGQSMLCVAARSDSLDLVELLLSHGATPDATQPDGATAGVGAEVGVGGTPPPFRVSTAKSPLCIAVYRGCAPVAAALLAAGADVCANRGTAAKVVCSQAQPPYILRVLRAMWRRVFKPRREAECPSRWLREPENHTPLGLAAFKDSAAMTQLLLLRDVPEDIRLAAFDVALRQGNSVCADLLDPGCATVVQSEEM